MDLMKLIIYMYCKKIICSIRFAPYIKGTFIFLLFRVGNLHSYLNRHLFYIGKIVIYILFSLIRP
jgi:hypothetical protein